MWLVTRLKKALRSLEAAQNLAAEVQGLRERIDALDAVQLDREIQWTETKTQVLRHLKRVQAIQQHHGDDSDGNNPVVAQILARKFPRNGGS